MLKNVKASYRIQLFFCFMNINTARAEAALKHLFLSVGSWWFVSEFSADVKYYLCPYSRVWTHGVSLKHNMIPL